MANVLFDCTQFLTFESSRVEAELFLTSFQKDEYFKMVRGKEISKKKLLHLSRFLNSHTVELVNQEFVGEFDEWFEFDKIPEKIRQFGQNIMRVMEWNSIEQLAIILVRYAYDEKNSDNIFTGDVRLENIYDGLYRASCFGNSGNIVVIRIKVEDSKVCLSNENRAK